MRLGLVVTVIVWFSFSVQIMQATDNLDNPTNVNEVLMDMEHRFKSLLLEHRQETDHKFKSLLEENNNFKLKFEKMDNENKELKKQVTFLRGHNKDLDNKLVMLQNDTNVLRNSGCYCRERSVVETSGNSNMDSKLQNLLKNRPKAQSNGYVEADTRDKRLLMPATTATTTTASPTYTRVAFHARMSKHLTDPGLYQHVEFDSVVTNIGDAYIEATGTFVSPTAGTYVFFVTMLSFPGKYVETELVVNGNSVAYIFSADEQHSDSGSSMVVIDLSEHDAVWVRYHNVHSDDTHHTGNVAQATRSSFSGYILWPNY